MNTPSHTVTAGISEQMLAKTSVIRSGSAVSKKVVLISRCMRDKRIQEGICVTVGRTNLVGMINTQ